MDTNTTSQVPFPSPINISESFHVGMEFFKKHWGKLLLANFAFIIPIIIFLIPVILLVSLTIPFFVLGTVGTSTQSVDYSGLYGIIGAICCVYLLLIVVISWMEFNYIKMFFNLYDGKEVSFGDMFKSPTKKYLVYLAVSIIVTLIVLLGFIFFIVPGIIFGLTFMFASFLVIDKGLGVGESMNRSSAITNGKKGELFGFGLVLFLISLVPMIILNVLGAIFKIPSGIISIVNLPISFATGVIVSFAQIDVYRKLSANYEAMNMPQTSAPEVEQTVPVA